MSFLLFIWILLLLIYAGCPHMISHLIPPPLFTLPLIPSSTCFSKSTLPSHFFHTFFAAFDHSSLSKSAPKPHMLLLILREVPLHRYWFQYNYFVQQLIVMFCLQHERPCCGGYTNSSRRRELYI